MSFIWLTLFKYQRSSNLRLALVYIRNFHQFEKVEWNKLVRGESLRTSNNKENALILNPLIKFGASWMFTVLSCVRGFFSPSSASLLVFSHVVKSRRSWFSRDPGVSAFRIWLRLFARVGLLYHSPVLLNFFPAASKGWVAAYTGLRILCFLVHFINSVTIS